MTVEVKNNLKRETVETGTVELSLSGPAARALLLVFNRVGGDPETTARKYIKEIVLSLEMAGIRIPYNSRETGDAFQKNGSLSGLLYFADPSLEIVEKVNV